LDADGLIFACALPAERRAARRLGRTALTGMAVCHGVPEGRLVSFGVAGGLDPELEVGTVIDATRIVDESGDVVWEGGPLGVPGARRGTILTAPRIVDGAEERERLHRDTGADAVDMESGVLARSGRLVGVIRAVSDTPSRQLGPLAQALEPDGSVALGRLLWAAARSPRACYRAGWDVQTALRALGSVGA
jgi:adenosylhomocysteine nucleosidase